MSGQAREAAPGDDLLRPSVLVAVALLLVNDHVLKAAAPGWITGKLSDVAGLYAAPFVVAATVAVAAWAAGRAALPGHRVVAISAVGIAAVFAAMKLAPEIAAAIGWALGWVQALPAVVAGLAIGTSVPIARVPIVPDATDLLALPAAGLAVFVSRRRRRPAT